MEINANNFQNATKQGVSLVDFYAPWCGPCRAQEPVIHGLAQRYEGRAQVSKMNIDQNRETASSLGISSIPTVVLFKDGREVRRFIGLQNERTLSDAIEKALN